MQPHTFYETKASQAQPTVTLGRIFTSNSVCFPIKNMLRVAHIGRRLGACTPESSIRMFRVGARQSASAASVESAVPPTKVLKTVPNDTDDFRLFMRTVPFPVSVITTIMESGCPIGITASSVSSLSMDPMTVTVGIHKGAKIFEHLRKSDAFVINILRDSQVHISNRFAKKFGSSEEQFKDLKFHLNQHVRLGAD
uniref:Flavin reductase like domain-containing protein n=2 Tax=Palpitomonas bilix TaxID=652834 RepID=A0A7S3LVL3_9EUKA|mmetsp:Transcript_50260/g.129388  ORF Transcript_50260/g.129388 Transcript_50260/m.129388 type:complete len:196 (+) Transcript_50260:47-634(+)